MGGVMLKELKKVTKLRSSKVEQGDFAVLMSPDIPSILVELGYLSNLEDESKLRSKVHRKKLSHALFNGIILYIRDTPVRNSYLRKYKKHIVKIGEKLKDLSKIYSVPESDIKVMNKLKTSRLRKGMKLYIPDLT